MAGCMEGYEVIGSDDGKLGHVVEVDGDFLIAEEGTLRKKRHAIPKAFAHPDDGEQVVRLTVSKELVEDSPQLQGGRARPEGGRSALRAGRRLRRLTSRHRTTRPRARSRRRSGQASSRRRRTPSEDPQGESEPGVRGRPIIPPDPHDPL